MNFLSLLFGVSTVEDLEIEFVAELAAEEINGLVGVADKTYSARKGAKKDLYEENMRHKQDEEQTKQWPEGIHCRKFVSPATELFHRLPMSKHGLHASDGARDRLPAARVDYWLTDGHDSYNDVLPNRRFRNLRPEDQLWLIS